MVTYYKKVEGLTGAGYPVGADMQGVMHIANTMYDVINDHISKDKPVENHWTLACRGSSGAILAGIVGFMMKQNKISCEILHIKKEGEKSHQEYATFQPKSKIIIIDDFITTGNTVNKIHEALVETGRPFEVDILIVGGRVDISYFDFQPRFIYAREVCHLMMDGHKFTKI